MLTASWPGHWHGSDVPEGGRGLHVGDPGVGGQVPDVPEHEGGRGLHGQVERLGRGAMDLLWTGERLLRVLWLRAVFSRVQRKVRKLSQDVASSISSNHRSVSSGLPDPLAICRWIASFQLRNCFGCGIWEKTNLSISLTLGFLLRRLGAPPP